jgi:hypothetical protein
MKLLLFTALLIIGNCDQKNAKSEASYDNYTWEQVLPFGNGSFQEKWKPGTFPLGIVPVLGANNHLWMTGQKMIWESADGLNWQKHDKTDWGERISMAYVYFKDTLWMFGGMMYKERSFVNDIWYSADGINWKQNPANAEWQPRKGQTVIVFKNKLWLLGGSNAVAADLSPNRFLNDTWSSADGKHWVLEKKSAEWPAREYPKVLVFNDTLYMMGGQGYGDVWKSANGKDWTLITNETEWKQRYDHGALVYDNKIWIFGGRDTSSNHTIAAKKDVWFSDNGITWNKQTEHALWTVRSGATSIVFKNNLWIFSGKHTGGKYNWGGDVWIMKK